MDGSPFTFGKHTEINAHVVVTYRAFVLVLNFDNCGQRRRRRPSNVTQGKLTLNGFRIYSVLYLAALKAALLIADSQNWAFRSCTGHCRLCRRQRSKWKAGSS